jgi:hypothetical protein
MENSKFIRVRSGNTLNDLVSEIRSTTAAVDGQQQRKEQSRRLSSARAASHVVMRTPSTGHTGGIEFNPSSDCSSLQPISASTVNCLYMPAISIVHIERNRLYQSQLPSMHIRGVVSHMTWMYCTYKPNTLSPAIGMSSYSFYGYSKESTAPNSPGNQDSMGSSMSPGADGQSLGSPGANSTSEGVRNICMLVHHDDCSSLCLFDGSNGANFYALIRLADITAVSLIQSIYLQCN